MKGKRHSGEEWRRRSLRFLGSSGRRLRWLDGPGSAEDENAEIRRLVYALFHFCGLLAWSAWAKQKVQIREPFASCIYTVCKGESQDGRNVALPAMESYVVPPFSCVQWSWPWC